MLVLISSTRVAFAMRLFQYSRADEILGVDVFDTGTISSLGSRIAAFIRTSVCISEYIYMSTYICYISYSDTVIIHYVPD